MPTFVSWCKQTQANLEAESERVKGGGSTFGHPIDYLDQVHEAIEKLESAVNIYELYIESTQIEELGAEGVGE